jgi:hypothetical protein
MQKMCYNYCRIGNIPVSCLEDWKTDQSPSPSTEVPLVFIQPLQTIAVIVALFEVGNNIIILYPFQFIIPYLSYYINLDNDSLVK